MELELDVNKMVEKEIQRQVKIHVETKIKDLTLNKLKTMGYDLKHLIKEIIREEISHQLDVDEVSKTISKEELITLTSEKLSELTIDIIKYSNY